MCWWRQWVLAGAGAGDDTFVNVAVSANMNAEAAYAYFLGLMLPTEPTIWAPAPGRTCFLLNWAVI
jgi:hypothetical protein